jgi:putative spermidine/putrescine transport system permease protein
MNARRPCHRTLPGPQSHATPRAWLVSPALIFILALFVYPFVYGLVLSFQPMNGGSAFANYIAFFTDTRCGPPSSSR